MSCNTVKNNQKLPKVQLTQQDFISTFPWGLRGDKVRILQQEVENEILDAETLAAIAFMLGAPSMSKEIDEIWKTLLNSQNHDVHVCLFDEVGIEWCLEARKDIKKIHDISTKFLKDSIGGSVVNLNTLSWNRFTENGTTKVPAFGYAITDSSTQTDSQKGNTHLPWDSWFAASNYHIRLLLDGSFEVKMNTDSKKVIKFGHFTVVADGILLDSREGKITKIETWMSKNNKQGYALVQGQLGDICYDSNINITATAIEFETTFHYEKGCNFGPDIKDFQADPRRTHYFQHENKLCVNWQIPGEKTELIYSSPYLTWQLASGTRSVESLHYTVLQAKDFGMAHFNIGQSGYGYLEDESTARQVLAFAPHDYIYGKPEQLVLEGNHIHRYGFCPFEGDWRSEKLPLTATAFQRSIVEACTDTEKSQLPVSASFVGIDSNTTIATALFERDSRVFVRLTEWAGQKDNVTILYGDESAKLFDCTHGLKQINSIDKSFDMLPWEIKTIELIGKAIPIIEEVLCSKAKDLVPLPSGWEIKSQFANPLPKAKQELPISDVTLYFSSGYHDGFVRPLQKHTTTMEIEMQRTKMKEYPNYASYWEIGGSCWVAMNKNEPEYLETLKPYIAEGKVEVVGGTWCEPLSLIVSGESNIRQFLYGMEAMKEHLNLDLKIYCNQEHGTFAQMPQILQSFGIESAVNRTQWAPYGYESGLDAAVGEWIGLDGSSIYLIPRYNTMDYKNCPWDDRNLQNGSVTGHNRVWRTKEQFEKLLDLSYQSGVTKPLMTMLEDIWAEELRTTDEEMNFYASLPYLKFTSLAAYLKLFTE